MSTLWFGRSSRRVQESEIRPGNRYRRQLAGHVAATATVLHLRSDLLGIPHVHFAITVDRSAMGRPEVDTRVLALQSFLDTYREQVA
jgi:hypothetical protein